MTAVRRDVFGSRVWSAQALRVVRDTAEALVVACCPGAEGMAPTDWIASRVSGDAAPRERAVGSLAAGGWRLAPWRWESAVLLLWNPPGTYFSVNAFYDLAGDCGLNRWYVNFQRPLRRTASGFDTFDLLLDLVVAPDLARWEWKDEDEYAHGRRLGVVGESDHRGVEEARGQVLGMIENREGPFADGAGLRDWRWDPLWPVPELPGGWEGGVVGSGVAAVDAAVAPDEEGEDDEAGEDEARTRAPAGEREPGERAQAADDAGRDEAEAGQGRAGDPPG